MLRKAWKQAVDAQRDAFQWKCWIPFSLQKKKKGTRLEQDGEGFFYPEFIPLQNRGLYFFQTSSFKMYFQLLANVFGSKYLPMNILHSFILLGFLLARWVMHKTVSMMLFLCGVLLKGCFLRFLQEPTNFSVERKIFPRDSYAKGRMCWRGAPPLGWHLSFSFFCVLDLVSAFSLVWTVALGLSIYMYIWTRKRVNRASEGVKCQRAAVNENSRYILYEFYWILTL